MRQLSYSKYNFLYTGILLLLLLFSCNNTPDNTTKPVIRTLEVTGVTDSSAVCGGEIIADGGSVIIERGICWDTTGNPTTDMNQIPDTSDQLVFQCKLTGLTAGTSYHVRAYAVNEKGTGYGEDVLFQTAEKDEYISTDIIRDVHFEKGFKLTPLDPVIVQQGGGFDKTYLDTLDFGNNCPDPVWMLAQWHSKYDLAHTPLTEQANGCLVYENEGKKIKLCPDHSLWLEVDASKEYDHPREQGEPWPHLLIAQQFRDNGPIVGAVDSLKFTMQIKVEKCENKMSYRTYNTLLHTAQTPFYFLIVNDNNDSPDYKQRLWFGIPSFDYRYPVLRNGEVVIWDVGTGTYIYDVPETLAWGNVSLHDGQWHTTKFDIKPHIARAITVMKGHGVFTNTSLDDLRIVEMNFGWEVPGTFDAAVSVKGIRLISVIKAP